MLQKGAEVAKVLIKYGPSGHVAHADLRNLLVKLDDKYGILQLEGEEERTMEADKAAGLWREILKNMVPS